MSAHDLLRASGWRRGHIEDGSEYWGHDLLGQVCHSLDAALTQALAWHRDGLEALGQERNALRTELDQERASKNQAYTERNRIVALLARLFPSGTRKTDIPGWDPEWHGCVFIDTAEGQLSWHYHDSDAHLFASLPPYEKPWDGHSTPEKYERLWRLTVAVEGP